MNLKPRWGLEEKLLDGKTTFSHPQTRVQPKASIPQFRDSNEVREGITIDGIEDEILPL